MSTWKPISTAPKDRRIDLWTAVDGRLVDCRWRTKNNAFVFEDWPVPIDRITHWREPDKGPGQEEGEVRWMVEGDGRLGITAYRSKDHVDADAFNVVRVRIVREEE